MLRISTMPEETLRAFQDHRRVEPRLKTDLDQAQYLFNQLYATGVDYEDVVATLERAGIEMFIASLDPLLDQIWRSAAASPRARLAFGRTREQFTPPAARRRLETNRVQAALVGEAASAGGLGYCE